MPCFPLLDTLSDEQLLDEAKRLVMHERAATAALLRALMELDSRRLYLREGCSSLFTYCTQVLHLAEGAAYNRIEAARTARRFAAVLDALADGSLPATVKRAVWQRDQGRCAFSGTAGRCRETGLLEFHHVKPFADGGGATAENIQLRCRAHNLYEASLWFGEGPAGVREMPGVWSESGGKQTEQTGYIGDRVLGS